MINGLWKTAAVSKSRTKWEKLPLRYRIEMCQNRNTKIVHKLVLNKYEEVGRFSAELYLPILTDMLILFKFISSRTEDKTANSDNTTKYSGVAVLSKRWLVQSSPVPSWKSLYPNHILWRLFQILLKRIIVYWLWVVLLWHGNESAASEMDCQWMAERESIDGSLVHT